MSNDTTPGKRLSSGSIVGATGLHLDRDYFSQFPFEYIDTSTGALILTFTDLVLPGHKGAGT